MRSASLRVGSPIWASETSREGQRKGAPPAFASPLASPLACMSRVSFSRYPPDRELARRPAQCKTAVDLSWKHLHRNLCWRLFKLGRTSWRFEAKSLTPIIIHNSMLLLLYWNIQAWKRTILGTVTVPSAWFVSVSFLFHDFKKFSDWYQEIITSRPAVGNWPTSSIFFNLQKVLMETFKSETVPKACNYLEKFLDGNPKDEIYCVGNKVIL